MNFYQYSESLLKSNKNIWIQGDSETGKTTFLKYLFDRDNDHIYKWLIGGSAPEKRTAYFQHVIKDIVSITYSHNTTISIYVDEVDKNNIINLIKMSRKLNSKVRIIIASHNLPPEDVKDQFCVYHMSEILSIQSLLKYIKENTIFDFSLNQDVSIADCFCIINNLKTLKSISDVNNLLSDNKQQNEKRIKSKTSVQHSIWILKTPSYEKVNVLKLL